MGTYKNYKQICYNCEELEIYLEARDGDLSFLLIEELRYDEVAGVLHGSEGTVQVSKVVMLQGGPFSSLITKDWR